MGTLQFTGVAMAIASFLGIWWGHVGVRWLEAHSTDIRPPMAVLIIAGIALNVYSFTTANLLISGVCSIIGITLLWDAYELFRQEKRIIKGHAPANPANPRHAAFLAAPNSHATVDDLLKREPLPHAPSIAKRNAEAVASKPRTSGSGD